MVVVSFFVREERGTSIFRVGSRSLRKSFLQRYESSSLECSLSPLAPSLMTVRGSRSNVEWCKLFVRRLAGKCPGSEGTLLVAWFRNPVVLGAPVYHGRVNLLLLPAPRRLWRKTAKVATHRHVLTLLVHFLCVVLLVWAFVLPLEIRSYVVPVFSVMSCSFRLRRVVVNV